MNQPKPSEVPLKQWMAEEAIRRGVSSMGIYKRIMRGKYPKLKLRRVNSRVVFVRVK